MMNVDNTKSYEKQHCTAAPPTFVPKFLFILHIYISSIVRKVEEIKQMYEIAQFFFSIKSL